MKLFVRNSTSTGSIAALVSVIAAIVMLGIAALFTTAAIEQRTAARAAAEIRFASLTLEGASHLGDTALARPVEEVNAARRVLQRDNAGALHALSNEEQSQVQRLLDQLAEGGDHSMHAPSVHSDLNALLEKAEAEASTAAADAERLAAFSIFVALAALVLMVWSWMRDRQRRQGAQIAESTALAMQNRLEKLLNGLPDMLLVFSEDGDITYRSKTVDQILPANARRADLVSLVGPHDRFRLMALLLKEDKGHGAEVFSLRTLDDRDRSLEVWVTDLTDEPDVGGYLVTARDVTKELQLRLRLEQQAAQDMLTGLPNRRALAATLTRAAELASREDASAGLCLLDLDQFKDINDTLGHKAGDDLLRLAAQRIRGTLRSGEHLLRLGGDEFAVVLAPITDTEALSAVAERIQRSLVPAFDLDDARERVRCSIGAALVLAPFANDHLLACADIALHEAKAAGGDRVVVFEPEMEDRATRIVNVTRSLRRADMDREFHLVFQPIVDSKSGETTSLEALLRWESPLLGTVGPAEFIEVAERAGLMRKIGRWVVGAVCDQLADWIDRAQFEGVSVSFNVSAQQLEDDSFEQEVASAVKSRDIDPARLVIEVTESMVIDHTGEIIDRLERLRAAGFRISVDDFGSGYSNIGQLLAVPLDVLKVDRHLLLQLSEARERAGGDPTQPCEIMQAIVSIANTLDSTVVCEGVETSDQQISLRASGVSHLQGYLLGRPVRPEELVESERLRVG